MSMNKLNPDGLRSGGLVRFALSLGVAAVLVYALVQSGLWHGVLKLN